MSDTVHPDFLLQSYRFDLPEDLIAQVPAPQREASRLLVLRRSAEETATGRFSDILRHLPENCLLVANNSRVFPARIPGRKPGGGKLEFLLLTPLPLLQSVLVRDETAGRPACLPHPGTWNRAEAEGLLRSSKKMRPGECTALAPDLTLEVRERGPFGRCMVVLRWQGELEKLLDRCGTLPLPPYIKRSPAAADPADAAHEKADAGAAEHKTDAGALCWGTDAERYQTTYARPDKAGSVAAPTAGLHFTPDLRRALAESGREWAEVTLYVGYGTFSPVRCADIRDHPMHAEYAELSPETAEAIARAKAEGRPVIAVGTTSARVLEGVFAAGRSLAPFAGWINIFLYPGRPCNVIDGLITNFHLPESSLLMLVSALAGRETILRAYRQAVRERFRFFSYGDAMLIL